MLIFLAPRKHLPLEAPLLLMEAAHTHTHTHTHTYPAGQREDMVGDRTREKSLTESWASFVMVE